MDLDSILRTVIDHMTRSDLKNRAAKNQAIVT
jgi:hypothetical protein